MMDGEEEIDASKVGIGFKTSLLAGNKHPQFDEQVNSLYDSLDVCTDINVDEDKKECIKNLPKKLEEVEILGEDRVGWQLDLANAYAFNAPNNDFNDLDLSQIGVWLTTSYRSTTFDNVVKRVEDNTCQELIKTRFKYQTGSTSGFTDKEIDTGIKNYQCTRDNNSDKIIFFDKNSEQKNCDSFLCVTQSGLSVIRIVDRIDRPEEKIEEDLSQEDKGRLVIEEEKLKQLEQCNQGLRVNERGKIPLISNQTFFRGIMNDLSDGAYPMVTSKELTNDDVNQYECRTLTTATEVKAFIVDKELPDSSLEKACETSIKAFMKENKIPLEEKNKYGCATFSWSDINLKISQSIFEDVDRKCEERIKKELKKDTITELDKLIPNLYEVALNKADVI